MLGFISMTFGIYLPRTQTSPLLLLHNHRLRLLLVLHLLRRVSLLRRIALLRRVALLWVALGCSVAVFFACFR